MAQVREHAGERALALLPRHVARPLVSAQRQGHVRLWHRASVNPDSYRDERAARVLDTIGEREHRCRSADGPCETADSEARRHRHAWRSETHLLAGVGGGRANQWMQAV